MKINVYEMTLLTPQHAGDRLGVTSMRMAQLHREGKIRALVTSDGHRLFLPEDVARLKRERDLEKEML